MSLIKCAAAIDYDHLVNQVNSASSAGHKSSLIAHLKSTLSEPEFVQFSATLKKHEDHWKARASAKGEVTSLIKVAANRYTKLFNAGGLSDNAISTLRQAGPAASQLNSKITAKGASALQQAAGAVADDSKKARSLTHQINAAKAQGPLRPLDQMIDGMDRGNRQILGDKLKEKGALNQLMALSMGGYATADDAVYSAAKNPFRRLLSPLHGFFDGKQKDRLHGALGVRHEVHEVSESGRGNMAEIVRPLAGLQKRMVERAAAKAHEGKGFAYKILSGILGHDDAVKAIDHVNDNNIGQTVGKHFNLAVLGKESNDVRKLSKLHGASLDRMTKLRDKKTGETGLLNRLTGKVYGKDAFTPSDLDKLRHAPHDVSAFGIIPGNYKTNE